MTTQNSSGFRSFTATAVALAEGVRVKVDSAGLISAAGATDAWIGITTAAVAASGVGSVKLRSAPGTFLVTASAAITRGARLYPTASGKVDDAAGTGCFTGLVALEAATADGDIIEAAVCDVLTFTASVDQAALVPTVGAAVATTAATNSTPYGYAQAQADRIVALINELRVDVLALQTLVAAMRTADINAAVIKGAA